MRLLAAIAAGAGITLCGVAFVSRDVRVAGFAWIAKVADLGSPHRPLAPALAHTVVRESLSARLQVGV